jgi:hypothetical protein
VAAPAASPLAAEPPSRVPRQSQGTRENDWRIYGCILHFDIKGGKIWLQHNGTEYDIPAQLVAMGVPKTDIVVGFPL